MTPPRKRPITTTTVRMPPEMRQKVEEIAKKEERSLTRTILKLLQEALDQRKEGGDE